MGAQRALARRPDYSTRMVSPLSGDLEARLRGDVHCFGEALSLQTELCLKLLQADKPSPCIVLTSSLQHYLLNALKDGLDDSVSSDFESGASDAISFWRRQQLADIPEETPPSLHPRLYKASLAWLGVVTQLGHAIQTGSTGSRAASLARPRRASRRQRTGRHRGTRTLGSRSSRGVMPAPHQLKTSKVRTSFDAEDYHNRRAEPSQRPIKAS